jgi:hypothetical protein
VRQILPQAAEKGNDAKQEPQSRCAALVLYLNAYKGLQSKSRKISCGIACYAALIYPSFLGFTQLNKGMGVWWPAEPATKPPNIPEVRNIYFKLN